MKSAYDVVVIGGGPGGSAVGNLLAQKGHQVALFEAREFPRFKVGESLIPAANLYLQELGVREQLDGLGFPRKHGVQFFSSRGPGRPFYFSEASNPGLDQTWQVLRSDFDVLLLEQATRAGVAAWTGSRVVGVEQKEDVVCGVRVRAADGTEHMVQARIVIDAAGERGILAQRFGQHQHLDDLANAAVFAHYRGARLDEGRDAGSTLIFRIHQQAWLWFIPLPECVSIGLVASARHLPSFGTRPEQMLEAAIADCAPLTERLQQASRSTDVHVARDFSYRARRDGGRGWMLVGDALGFMDPIYSTGLLLTLLSADLAAQTLDSALQNGNAAASLQGWSLEYQQAFDRFLPLVRAYYRDGFHFGPLAKDPLQRRGLVDLLTGDVSTAAAQAVSENIERILDQ